MSALLSFNAGYVDTAGFLAMQGLFTAHVTGNFVTLGATIIMGTSGILAKLLALPTFCFVVLLTRLVSYRLPALGLPVLRSMLTVKFAFLTIGGALAVIFGPFGDGDALPAIFAGMALVAAMAIQNAIHRIHLGSAPPTTLMTGTTTQIMIDLADAMRGFPGGQRDATRARMSKMLWAVACFAVGCGSGALLFNIAGNVCFVVPPFLALLSLAIAFEPPADVGTGDLSPH